MGRTAVTAHERAQQYAYHGFYCTDSATVFCKYCNCCVGWEKKDNIEKHITSGKHIVKRRECATVSEPKQTSIIERLEGAKRRKHYKDYFAKRTVEVFAKANIPLEKLENETVRNWIAEFSSQGELPNVRTLREKYLPEVASDHKKSTTEALVGKKINVLCDETTDRMGRCVFVVLFQVPEANEKKLFIAGVKYLESGNATNCSRAVLDTLHDHSVQYDAVKVFVSDSARYMTLCYETLKVIIGDQLLHVQCWAHKLCLVGNCWTAAMSDLNQVVTMVKSAFLNTRKRKYNYLHFLKSTNGDLKAAKLFPSPVLTRWNSWFEAVFYLASYFHDVVMFFKLPEMRDVSNSGVAFLRGLTDRDVDRIYVQIVFVKEHASELVELLTLLEGSQYPTSHMLYPKLESLDTNFGAIIQGHYSEATDNALAKLSALECATSKDLFVKAIQSARSKLAALKASDPNRKNFEVIAQVFYPRHVVLNNDIETHIQKLPGFTDIPRLEIKRGYDSFKKIIESQLKENEKCDVVRALNAVQYEHVNFAKSALNILWTPTNNVDSERVLSHYSTVVTDRRCNLKECNAELFTILSFEH